MTILLDAFDTDVNDPQVIAAQEDFNDLANLITSLVALRKRSGLRQKDVARMMGTKQSAVSAIESSCANPTIERLQRYARAVGATLKLNAEWDTGTDLSQKFVEQAKEREAEPLPARSLGLTLVLWWIVWLRIRGCRRGRCQ